MVPSEGRRLSKQLKDQFCFSGHSVLRAHRPCLEGIETMTETNQDCKERYEFKGWMDRLPMPGACLTPVKGGSGAARFGTGFYTIQEVNEAFVQMTGRDRHELIGLGFEEVVTVSDKEWQQLLDVLEIGMGAPKRDQLQFYCESLRIWCEIVVFPLGEDCLGMILQDVTERREAERQLQQSLDHARALFNVSRDGLVIIGQDHRVIDANASFCKMLGYSLTELRELHTWDWEVNFSEERIRAEFADLATVDRLFESHHRRKDGSIYPVELSTSGVAIGDEPVLIAVCRDISERKEREMLLEYLSYHDALTGLYNRMFFNDTLAKLRNMDVFPLTLLMVDLDHLSQINNEFGHAAGDAHLRTAANLLRRCLRRDDLVARVGGDEFAVIMPKTTFDEAERVLVRIEAECRRFNAAEPLNPLMMSLGCSTAEERSQPLETVLHHADMEMYQAKRSRRG